MRNVNLNRFLTQSSQLVIENRELCLEQEKDGAKSKKKKIGEKKKKKRRENMAPPKQQQQQQPYVGERPIVCFSGGGVRSALFNLGVSLAGVESRLWPPRGVVTVSGGGWIGCGGLLSFLLEARGDWSKATAAVAQNLGIGTTRGTVKPVSGSSTVTQLMQMFASVFAIAGVTLLLWACVVEGAGAWALERGGEPLRLLLVSLWAERPLSSEAIAGALHLLQGGFVVALLVVAAGLAFNAVSVVPGLRWVGGAILVPVMGLLVAALLGFLAVAAAGLFVVAWGRSWSAWTAGLSVASKDLTAATVAAALFAVTCKVKVIMQRISPGPTSILVGAVLVPLWMLLAGMAHAFLVLSAHACSGPAFASHPVAAAFCASAPFSGPARAWLFPYFGFATALTAAFLLTVMYFVANGTFRNYRANIVSQYMFKDVALSTLKNDYGYIGKDTFFLPVVTQNSSLVVPVAVSLFSATSYAPVLGSGWSVKKVEHGPGTALQSSSVGTLISVSAAVVAARNGFEESGLTNIGAALLGREFWAGSGPWKRNMTAAVPLSHGVLWRTIVAISILTVTLIVPALTLNRDSGYALPGAAALALYVLSSLAYTGLLSKLCPTWLFDLLCSLPTLRFDALASAASVPNASEIQLYSDGGHLDNLGLVGLLAYLKAEGMLEELGASAQAHIVLLDAGEDAGKTLESLQLAVSHGQAYGLIPRHKDGSSAIRMNNESFRRVTDLDPAKAVAAIKVELDVCTSDNGQDFVTLKLAYAKSALTPDSPAACYLYKRASEPAFPSTETSNQTYTPDQTEAYVTLGRAVWDAVKNL